MGHTHPDTLLEEAPPPVKERVENKGRSQTMSKVVSVTDGGTETRRSTHIDPKKFKPTYVEILSRGARNEPG